jgi:hypothetical protein
MAVFSHKKWREMDGWEKTVEVAQVGGSVLALVALPILALFGGASAGGSKSSRGFGERSSTSVWTRGFGGKKPGSWSSGRHG